VSSKGKGYEPCDDWGVHGITVNCLAQGWFKTSQNAVMYQDEQWVSCLRDRIRALPAKKK
jgi:NAD(P)-dependent dehydrogenase (short-subunit alcohol dehydrogenase family)